MQVVAVVRRSSSCQATLARLDGAARRRRPCPSSGPTKTAPELAVGDDSTPAPLLQRDRIIDRAVLDPLELRPRDGARRELLARASSSSCGRSMLPTTSARMTSVTASPHLLDASVRQRSPQKRLSVGSGEDTSVRRVSNRDRTAPRRSTACAASRPRASSDITSGRTPAIRARSSASGGVNGCSAWTTTRSPGTVGNLVRDLPAALAVTGALSILAAWLSWRLVERPVLEWIRSRRGESRLPADPPQQHPARGRARGELGDAAALGRRRLAHPRARPRHRRAARAGPAIVLAAGALAALPAGRAMDRAGRVPVLALGFGTGAAGCALAALGSATAFAPAVLGGLMCVGAASAVALLARTAAGDMYPPAHRARGIAMILFGVGLRRHPRPGRVQPAAVRARAVRRRPRAALARRRRVHARRRRDRPLRAAGPQGDRAAHLLARRR